MRNIPGNILFFLIEEMLMFLSVWLHTIPKRQVKVNIMSLYQAHIQKGCKIVVESKRMVMT